MYIFQVTLGYLWWNWSYNYNHRYASPVDHRYTLLNWNRILCGCILYGWNDLETIAHLFGQPKLLKQMVNNAWLFINPFKSNFPEQAFRSCPDFFSWQTLSKEISIQHINNKGTILTSEAATGGLMYEKVLFLEIWQNSQENTCAKVSFIIKLQAWGLQLYLKRDSDAGVFLWILRNF